MTLTLDLTPEEEERVLEAQAAGVDVGAMLRQVLSSLPVWHDKSSSLTDQEWDELEAELTEGIDPSIPALSDEAISRASIYGDRA